MMQAIMKIVFSKEFLENEKNFVLIRATWPCFGRL